MNTHTLKFSLPRRLLATAFVLLIAAAVLALPWLPAVMDRDDFYGLRVDLPAEPLPGPGGEPLTTPEGSLDVVFFGFQHCNSVCPARMLNLMTLHRRLSSAPVRFVFVSLDPERDSGESLENAMATMGPTFLAVRPETGQQARQLASRYHDYSSRNGMGDGYDIEHSGHLHVVSSRGRRELLYTSRELDLDRVVADLRQLLSSVPAGTSEIALNDH
ncbi:Cytochrome oxidase Cu insertion factor, SCO1/SenC/PrrC family [Marinobacter daqiaonensis]|uniref:Cytochrome oxidase Cu insertion factor, SCO1/SenC/PrrC family n=1 Tax=Marinobacter daqiaonensis TaxID=650891 RepID=A0A1I6JPL5_9GAMM|nr:SCO family protein [Marinobacter daqiaonensis]SFR80929.1 Cytochrome oxidase Cu insertion factor, SCO1/SenC/PrrC family [Marinobacter daqiaonensis]